MRKEIKKLMVASLSLALLVSASGVVNCSASEGAIAENSFCFNVKANCAASKNPGDDKQRTANRTDNAWSVNFKTSNETATGNTSTRFYLGKVIENHTNEYGSPLHTVREGSGKKYFSAYSKVCPGKVCLYARDNEDGSTGQYTISGEWSPQTGHNPANDGD